MGQARPDELYFEEGDIIYITDMSDTSWWKGTCKGRTGLIPSNYVAEQAESIDNPLHEAAKRGNLSWLRECLDNRVGVNGLDKAGSTALYWACHGGHKDIVEVLFTQPNVELNQQNKLGDTALHAAAWKGYADIVQLLLAKGARTDLRNNEKKLALDMATNAACASLLKKKQATVVFLSSAFRIWKDFSLKQGMRLSKGLLEILNISFTCPLQAPDDSIILWVLHQIFCTSSATAVPSLGTGVQVLIIVVGSLDQCCGSGADPSHHLRVPIRESPMERPSGSDSEGNDSSVYLVDVLQVWTQECLAEVDTYRRCRTVRKAFRYFSVTTQTNLNHLQLNTTPPLLATCATFWSNAVTASGVSAKRGQFLIAGNISGPLLKQDLSHVDIIS
ncbi:osteoclast stimulating factor 1 [Cricetulus griseus]